MVTAGIFPFEENSHGRAGNQTRDVMISSQRLRPQDHEAGHTLYHKRHDFILKKMFIDHKTCFFFIFSRNLSESFHILRRIQRGTVTNVHWSSLKVPVYFVTLNKTYIFIRDFENTQISNLIKFNPVRAEVPWRRTDRRTDTHEKVK